MTNANKLKSTLIICLLFIITAVISNENDAAAKSGMSYDSIIKQAKMDNQIIPEEVVEKNEKLQTKLPINPTSPKVIQNFFCDPLIKINSVRQDVMTNRNYSK